MKTKHQTKQRIMSRLVFCFAIMFLLCPTTIAQQLEPNPNPVGNTITVTTYAENSEYFDNLGTIDNDGLIDNWYQIDNYGTIDSKGIINNCFGIHNSGFISNDGQIDNSGDFSNAGVIEISGSGSINNIGIFSNGGYIDNLGYISNIGGAIENFNTINNMGYIGSGAGTFNNHGIFKGTGTFVGTLDTGDGTVAPGSSAGTMYVEGDYILDGSGILDIEIGGFDTGEYDLLDITGTAFLPGGNINFSFVDGYDIVTDVGPGDTLELSFLNAGCIDSLFDPVINYNFGSLPDFEFNVFQMGDDLYFQATNTVPVPGAVLLGILGVGAVGIKLRKYA